MSDWQPIETAPRDGSALILGGMKYGPRVAEGQWGPTTFDRKAKSYKQGWTTSPGHEVEPTHWMPLPEGPKP